MILVDTSIWIDHFHSLDMRLQSLLEQKQVLIHPFVVGEISLGNLRQYDLVMRSLSRLYQIAKASDEDVLYFIRTNKLQGAGIGYVDAHLAAAAMLTPGTYLWTRDKRLQRVAENLRIAAPM
jgi:predicted nucleic acid-binding protein